MRVAGWFAELIVTDTGIGIPFEHIPHIFERFYRVDPARSRDAGGTGLGLSICRIIAESHGGTIRLESNEGKGTRVVVTLPVLQPDALPDVQQTGCQRRSRIPSTLQVSHGHIIT